MQKNTWARLRPHIFLHICTKEESIIRRFDGEPHGGGASRSLAAVGGVQGFFSEYSLFLIVLFAAITVVFISIILALAVYICKAGIANDKCLYRVFHLVKLLGWVDFDLRHSSILPT